MTVGCCGATDEEVVGLRERETGGRHLVGVEGGGAKGGEEGGEGGGGGGGKGERAVAAR